MQISSVLEQVSLDVRRWADDPREVRGLPTGIQSLDEMWGGLMAPQLIYLAASTGVGKSALAAQIGYHVAQVLHDTQSPDWVYVLSNEMTEKQYALREVSGRSGVSLRDLRRGRVSDLSKLRTAIQSLTKLPVDITYRPGMPMKDTFDLLSQGVKEHRRPALVVYDYAQKAQEEGQDRRNAVRNISNRLEKLSKWAECPVLALAQLKRLSDPEQAPCLYDLAESGDLERDAHGVWLLWRPGMRDYTQDTSAPQDAELIIDKNREGDRGPLPLTFHPATMRFTERASLGTLH